MYNNNYNNNYGDQCKDVKTVNKLAVHNADYQHNNYTAKNTFLRRSFTDQD